MLAVLGLSIICENTLSLAPTSLTVKKIAGIAEKIHQNLCAC